MQYKIELERVLTRELRKRQGCSSEVTVTEDGQFALYNVADRYTVRRLSDLGKDFLHSGQVRSVAPDDYLVGGLVHSDRTKKDLHFLRFPYRCRDCGGDIGMRSRPRKWVDRYVLPLLLLKPVRCATCFRRDYWPISTRVRECANAESIAPREWQRKVA